MSLRPLLELEGSWQGRSKLQDPIQGGVDESSSNLEVTRVLSGKFVRLDYDWSYRGEPQEGSLLFGFDPESREVSAHWIDSWHMGRAVMACKGRNEGDGSYRVTGSYSIPGADAWGWRIELDVQGEPATVVMYNISPQGEEFLAVEASYTKV